jgi:hypothetical protein
MLTRVMSPPSWKPLDGVTRLLGSVRKAGRLVLSSAGRKAGRYGQGKKHYQRGRVERIEVRALYGKARLQYVLSLLGYQHINTSAVERHNGTSRLRNQRKVRKTLAFSKAPRSHRWMSWLSVGL